MSISVGNGGIGQNPAISRINHLSPEKELKAITYKMRQIVQPVETRTLTTDERTQMGSNDLWKHAIPASQNPYYPPVKLNIRLLTGLVSTIVNKKTTQR